VVFEYGVVLASLMGAAAALTGGVLAQRYQYLLERQKEHFAALRDGVLAPWSRAIAGRLANLEGRDPYVVIDYVAKDYRVSPAGAAVAGGEVPWSESSRLAQESRKHWSRLWSEWDQLNRDQVALGERIVATLRTAESSFPPLPAGKTWTHYPNEPKVAAKLAVVSAWASHAQTFERRNYPDWVASQLTQFGFWTGGGDEDLKRAFAEQVAALLANAPGIAKVEADAATLHERYESFAGRVEDAIQTERMDGTCDYCPRFLR
jgi:hypothetical protein